MINQVSYNFNQYNSAYKNAENVSVPSFSGKKKPTEQTPEVKKSNKFGLKIAIGAVSLGFGIIAVTKGLPLLKKSKINDLLLNLEKKSQKLKNKTNKTSFIEAQQDVIDKAKAATNTYKTMLNFTSIKDAAFKKFTDKIPLVGKFFNGLTNITEKMAVKTVKNSYKKTNAKFNKLFGQMYEINCTLDETNLGNFNAKADILRKKVNANFGAEETSFRLHKIKDSFKGIADNIWEDVKNPKSLLSDRGSYTNCIAEQMSVSEKNKLRMNVNELRNKIFSSKQNDIKSMKELLTNINSVLNPFSKKTINAMRNVDNAMKAFTKDGSIIKRTNLLNKIKDLNELVPDEVMRKEFTKSINSFNNVSNGELQKLLEEYQAILSRKDYNKLEKTAQKACKALDNSIDMETSRLFDKIRDLEIGSAPTDLISLLGTTTAVIFGVGKAETKDEKISAALKFGIPAIGAVTTSLICTMSLVAAGPSLAIGMLSGFAINRIGETADKIRKLVNDANEKTAENNKIEK